MKVAARFSSMMRSVAAMHARAAANGTKLPPTSLGVHPGPVISHFSYLAAISSGVAL